MTGDSVRWQPVEAEELSVAEVVGYLRARCPWAAAHTHSSLAPYLLEETYELLDAIRSFDEAPDAAHRAELIGELGDVAYQVLFHAALLDSPDHTASTQCPPTGEYVRPHAITEVLEALRRKVIRRHPHVFETSGPVSIDEVERRYEEIKASERSADPRTAGAAQRGAGTCEDSAGLPLPVRDSLASVPRAMPALARAQAVMSRLERARGDLGETDRPASAEDPAAEVGRLLLEIVGRARDLGIDPEEALHRAVGELSDRAVSEYR